MLGDTLSGSRPLQSRVFHAHVCSPGVERPQLVRRVSDSPWGPPIAAPAVTRQTSDTGMSVRKASEPLRNAWGGVDANGFVNHRPTQDSWGKTLLSGTSLVNMLTD